tara:strand:- start:564 stop:1799 length:1236 start_codon:yes stop_codon:yes gene_type:complete
MAYTPFKMRGPSLYKNLKVNRNGYKAMDDGRANSSPFQQTADEKTIDELIQEGFTPEDARRMQKDGAATGEQSADKAKKTVSKVNKMKKDAAQAKDSPSKFLGGLKKMGGKFLKGEGAFAALNPMGAIANSAGLFQKKPNKEALIEAAKVGAKAGGVKKSRMKKDPGIKRRTKVHEAGHAAAVGIKAAGSKKKSPAKKYKSAAKQTGVTVGKGGSVTVSKKNRTLGKDKTTTYSPVGRGKVLAEVTKTGKNKTKTKNKVVSEKKAGKKIMKAAKASPAKQGLKKLTPEERAKFKKFDKIRTSPKVPKDKVKDTTKTLKDVGPRDMKKIPALNKKYGKSPAKQAKKAVKAMGKAAAASMVPGVGKAVKAIGKGSAKRAAKAIGKKAASAVKKPLVGKQKNLPDHLKKKILEA